MSQLKGVVSHHEREIAELRADRELAVAYLKAAMESLDDPEERAAGLLVLRTVAKAHGGLGAVVAEAGISRESPDLNVDNAQGCCHGYNMPAALLLRSRVKLSDNRFADILIWQLPEPASGSGHSFKYRLALVIDEVCVLRYDNESGKGDHKHVGAREISYACTTLDQLVDDFWADVARL